MAQCSSRVRSCLFAHALTLGLFGTPLFAHEMLAQGGKVPSARPSTSAPPSLRLTPIAVPRSTTFDDAWGDEMRLVVRDSAAWRHAWHSAVGASPLPVVDFTTDIAVLVAIHNMTSIRYSIAVDSARRTGPYTVVTFTIREPGLTCSSPDVFIRPIAAARFPRDGSQSVSFVERHIKSSCTPP